jgi:queuine tRNA-ribosyltransferase
MYTIQAEDGRAKCAAQQTPHGVIETPVFMNVATCAAIKGAVSAADLHTVGCQVALAARPRSSVPSVRWKSSAHWGATS